MAMDKEIPITILVAMTAVGLIIALQPVLPSGAQRYSELGVLGPNMAIGGYPTNLTRGEIVHLFCYVGNHEGAVTYYQVLIKLGNSATQVSNTTAASAPLLFSYLSVLADNTNSTFPVSFSVGTTGSNLRLIFELWSYDTPSSQFVYTGLWDQLWVNVTGGT